MVQKAKTILSNIYIIIIIFYSHQINLLKKIKRKKKKSS